MQGYLGAGSAISPFSQKLVFTMTPNTAGNRANYAFTLQQPAEPQYPRSLGHKAFAVVRGGGEEVSVEAPCCGFTITSTR